jgi:hypothetical protein
MNSGKLCSTSENNILSTDHKEMHDYVTTVYILIFPK